jgi:predicted HicB family RNase H-like nuclease
MATRGQGRQDDLPPDPRDEGQVALHLRVHPELRTRARRAAQELGIPMRSLIEEAVDTDLRRRGY